MWAIINLFHSCKTCSNASGVLQQGGNNVEAEPHVRGFLAAIRACGSGVVSAACPCCPSAAYLTPSFGLPALFIGLTDLLGSGDGEEDVCMCVGGTRG